MKSFLALISIMAAAIIGWLFFNKNAEAPTIIPDSMVEVKEIKMIGDKFRFDPAEIKLKLGDKVKIVLTSVDMPHDFDLDELKVDGPIAKPGETTAVEFIADRVGEFEYYCSVGQHRANGMVGKLIVE